MTLVNINQSGNTICRKYELYFLDYKIIFEFDEENNIKNFVVNERNMSEYFDKEYDEQRKK